MRACDLVKSLEEDSIMHYVATQRCPICQSANTTVKIAQGTILREGVSIDVRSIWTCGDCKRDFGPNTKTQDQPILMCKTCKQPMPHVHQGMVDAVWHNPVGISMPMNHEDASKVKLENYRCTCGTERPFGFAK
jgi:hypothetical protein